MKYEDKTKKQLAKEIAKLRQKITGLEKAEAERKQAEEKIKHLSAVLRAIRKVNQLITREKDRDRLLKGVCDNLIKTRGYYYTWIEIIDEAGKFVASAEAGLGDDFAPLIERLRRGKMPDCARIALSQSDVLVIKNHLSTCGKCPLSKKCEGRGAMVIRLEYREKIYGLLAVAIPVQFLLEKEETSLFKEVAGDLAFALYSIELEEELKRAELVVLEARAYAESIVDTVRVPLVVLDSDLRVISANSSFYQSFKVKPNETEGQFIYDLGNRQWDIPRLRQLLENILPKNTFFDDFEVEHDFPTLGKRTMLLNARRISRGTKGTQMILLAIEDITERKRADELALRLATIVESSDDAIISKTLDGTIVTWNKAAERIFGYSAEEVFGRPISILMPPAYKDEMPAILEKVKRGEDAEHFETVRMRKDGERINISLTISPIKDAEGKIRGVSTIARDITERKQAEEKLKEYSERLEELVEKRTKELKEAQEQLLRRERLAVLGQLAGGVGHELRNPLGVISNAVYYLKTTLSDADKTTKEYLEMISSEVRNSEKIVTDLLDLSHTRPPEREEAAVSELVKQVLDSRPPTEKIKVIMEISSELPAVYVDPRQISQVLDNIVLNSYQAMPGGGKVTIKARPVKNKVLISVADTGCGISKRNMKKLFEPLFTTRPRGIGLGLSVSKNLLESNGGKIKVKSEEGKGSTFIVTLPTMERK